MSKLVRKITNGFVVQVFNEETRKIVDQEFISCDEYEITTLDGEVLDSASYEDLYHPFNLEEIPHND